MKNKRIYILFSALIAIFCSSVIIKTMPNDTFSAIKIGNYILHNGIDFVEHFNFNDLSYHNARWLFNVIVALIYNKFNFTGLYIFSIINSIILGLIMFNTLLKRNKNLLLSFVITIISMELAGGYIGPRAQMISYILLFLEVLFIEKLIKENKIKYIFVLLPISVLIANIHTTIWPMTLILFLPYFAEYFMSRFIKKSKVLYVETKSIKLLSISFLIILLSGLLTPLGLLPYTYMFKTLSGISSKYIIELQKANVFFEFSLLVLFIIYIFLFIYLRKKIKISDIFLVLGLFFMSIMAVRNIPFLIIICSISLSRLIMDNLDAYKINLDVITTYLYKDRFIMILIPIFIIFISSILFIKNSYGKKYIDESKYPTKAANYILKNIDLDKLRLYNDFNDGAYLEFRGIKVFIDSRSEIYCKEFNNTTILQDWYFVSSLTANYKYIFNNYNFTHILLYKREPINNYIVNDSDYKIIYSDEYFVLYEKVE